MLPLHLYEYQWVIPVAALGYVPLAAVICSLCGLFVWSTARIARRFPRLPMAAVFPIVWTGIEVFRGEVFFTGYPWLLVSHPLIDAPVLAQPASLIGAYGVSALTALWTGVIADCLWNRRLRPAFAGACVAAIAYAGAWMLRPAAGGSALRIAVIQSNIPQDNKNEWTAKQRAEDYARLADLTRQAAAVRPAPDLIVWPETMFPGYFLDPLHIRDAQGGIQEVQATQYVGQLLDLQRSIGVPLMIGAMGAQNLRLDETEQGERLAFDTLYNSVFLVRDGRVQPERYDKIDLTPFGEVMPYIQHWPWLQRQLMALAAGGLTFDLSAGRMPRVFMLSVHGATGTTQAAIATPICFEATKAARCRSLVRQAGSTPCILVNLTNDGWFGTFDPARWQHLQIARWRAVELNTPVVRAANTGVSAAIDGRGRVMKQGVDGPTAAARVDGVLTTDILLSGAPTIYSRCGDVLGWSCLVATGVMLTLTYFRASAKESA